MLRPRHLCWAAALVFIALFSLPPALANRVHIVTGSDPTDALAGQVITSSSLGPIEVEVLDETFERDTSFTADVYAALDPAGGLGGTRRQPANKAGGGLAVFDDLTVKTVSTPGTYTLSFFCDGCLSDTSLPFRVTAGSAVRLKITFQPTTPVTAGSPITTTTVEAVDVDEIRDANTDRDITVSITGTGACGASLEGTTTRSTGGTGQADFTDLKIKAAGVGYTLTFSSPSLPDVTSVSFDVTAETAADSVEITTQPPASVVAQTVFSLSCTLKDSHGNTVAVGETVELTTAATLTGTTSDSTSAGTVIFSDLRIEDAGAYTITASCTTCSGSPTPGTSTSITVVYDTEIIISGGPVITEGGSGEYSVVLASQPQRNAQVDANFPSGITLDAVTTVPYPLIFTPSDWDTPQTIYVDADAAGAAGSVSKTYTITHSATSTDPGWASPNVRWMPMSDVTVTVVNDDFKVISITGGGYIDEATPPSPATYNIELLSPPAVDPTTISITVSPAGAATVDRPSIDFTAATSGPEPVVVTAVDDNIARPGGSRVISVGHVVTAGDTSFIFSPSNTIEYGIFDNDVPNVRWTPAAVTVFEGKSTTTVVTLGTEPAADVQVSLSCTPGTAEALPATQTLTASSYSTGVTFTITAIAGGGTPGLSYDHRCQASLVSDDPVYNSPMELPSEGAGEVLVAIYRRACVGGTFSATCDLCPAGSQCAGGVSYPCPPGTYSNAGDATCTPCPIGHQCDDPSNVPPALTACPAGTYAHLNGTVLCDPCPAGHECTDNTALPRPCAAGWYNPAKSNGPCTECGAGKYCPPPRAVELDCPAGYYSQAPTGTGGAEYCTICPAGSSCTATAATACALGQYAPEGTPDPPGCFDCPAGMACNVTAPTEVCPLGTFSELGNDECRTCPAGFECTDPGAAPVQCSNAFPANTHYSLGGQVYCTPCPAGYRCDNGLPGDQPPVRCLEGQYSYEGDGRCRACDPGYLCPPGSATPSPRGAECPEGTHCEVAGDPVFGQVVLADCNAGTWGPMRAARSQADCRDCPGGFYCPAGTGVFNQYPCPAGYWCDPGSTTGLQHPCVDGTYNDEIGAVSQDDCKPCPGGTYCPDQAAPGITDPTRCPAGYFCPQGIDDHTFYPCFRGTYSPNEGIEHPSDCLECPMGHYCLDAAVEPTPCPPGTFNKHPGAGYFENCELCPPTYTCPLYGQTDYAGEYSFRCAEGHYCPRGTERPDSHPCPPGTYSNKTGVESLASPQECHICPPGKACDWGTTGPTGTKPPVDCAAGFYCPAGTSVPSQYPCPPGTYDAATNLTDSFQCDPCPAGSYCLGGDTAVTGLCLEGYYCPEGSSTNKAFPCPAGTFRATPGATSVDDCANCTATNYCNEASTSQEVCPDGSYSDGPNFKYRGPSDSYPSCIRCPAGYSCTAGDRANCTAGSYSRSGQSSCTPCPEGHFCDSDTTSEAEMLSNKCAAGRLCNALSIVQDPTDTDDRPCPAGSYCPTGTTAAVSCPAGTYNNLEGRGSLSDCRPTPAGNYSDPGETNPLGTGECDEGHFCPEGSSSPTQEPCPPRTYRNLTGGRSSDDCAPCPTGFYCTGATSDPTPCDIGFYCTLGVDRGFPCPPGTFGNVTGLRRSTDCEECTPGYYCDQYGLSDVSGPCDPGFYCSGRSATSAPRDDIQGNICPAGGYCEAGSPGPSRCPIGKYNAYEGGKSLANCLECPPGLWCGGTGAALPQEPCKEGFFCPGGAQDERGKTDNDTEMPAQPGYYAPAGAHNQIPCPVGTFQANNASSSCNPCPGGFYCDEQNLDDRKECPEGTYCPSGASIYLPCPPGTYRNETGGQVLATDCKGCEDGKYCPDYGMTSATLDCEAGYFCKKDPSINKGSDSPAPQTTTSTGGPCPAGHYCGNGTGDPTPCDPGFYAPTERNVDSDGCLPCTPGWYCATAGLAAPTGLCDANYFCERNNTNPRPGGDECKVGHKCPAGSTRMVPCEEGTYQDQDERSECLTCPAGSYCGVATGFPSAACPEGHFCPAGTRYSTEFPCPAGTYNPDSGKQTWHACLECPPGRYCPTQGLDSTVSPTGSANKCDGGFYCTGGSIYPNPVGINTSYADPVAGEDTTICGGGPDITYPTQTAAEDYCTAEPTCIGVVQHGSGDWHPRCGSATSTATWVPNAVGVVFPQFYRRIQGGGGRCTAGHFCPAGSTTENPCDPGFYCAADGLNTTTGSCAAGFYCDAGAAVPAPPDRVCPKGGYCPAGTTTVRNCQAGEFQPSRGNDDESDCFNCTSGYYCATPGLPAPTGPCDVGHYCEEGSSSRTQNPCPAGHRCPVASSFPIPCTVGSYQPSGQQGSCIPCGAGVYCIEGASSSTPPPCAKGFYCPAGTAYRDQYPCPVGTFRDTDGAETIADCSDCTAGNYCDELGLDVPAGSCDPGYYCPANSPSESITPRPLNNYCRMGEYCPAASGAPTNCPAGLYCGQGRLEHPSGFCQAGHVCTSRSSTAAPLNTHGACSENMVGLLCDPGHYCMSGSTIRTIAGGGGSTNDNIHALDRDFTGGDGPEDAIEDADGNVYLTYPGEHIVLRIDKGTRNITTIIGTGTAGAIPPGPVLGTAFPLDEPRRLAMDTKGGVLYVSDSGNNRVIKYLIADEEAEVLTTGLSDPRGMEYDPSSTELYVALAGSHEVVSLDTTNGARTVVAGTSGTSGSAAGFLDTPMDVTLDSSGNIYVADFGNHMIRDGSLATIPACTTIPPCVGDGNDGSDGDSDIYKIRPDSGSFDTVSLSGPTAVQAVRLTVTREALFIADQSAHRIRFIPFWTAPKIYTVAGDGTGGFTKDGGALPANEAQVHTPTGLNAAVRQSNGYAWHLYVGDKGSNRIRQLIISPTLYESSSRQKCPVGSYMPWTGNTAEQDCILCDPGMYCSSLGLTAPTGPCQSGYYCPEGSSSVTAVDCPAGHYCEQRPGVDDDRVENKPASSTTAIPGFPPSNAVDGNGGTYWQAAFTGATYLEVSLEEWYLVDRFHITIVTSPDGLYLTAFTLQYEDFSATSGQWVDFTIEHSISAPNTTIDAAIDPPRPVERLRLSITSTAGTGNIKISDFNVYGSKSTGAPVAVRCSPGTFQEASAQASCLTCPAGYYCDGIQSDRALDCPAGYYCPEGTEWGTQYPCPVGTYSDVQRLTSYTECKPCSAGQYCARRGLSAPSGLCAAGYYCREGNFLPAPRVNETNPDPLAENVTILGGPCPPGSYCLEGTEYETQYTCQSGFFSVSEGADSNVSCVACTAGYYCENTTTTIRQPCLGGYVCLSGSDTGQPDGSDSGCPDAYPCKGYPCPEGYYCPAGTFAEKACPPGTYSGARAPVCSDCPPGKYCPISGLNASFVQGANAPYICPFGHYCPEGSITPVPSLPGYFVDYEGAQKPTPCTNGEYCSGYGLSSTSGRCAPGFGCQQPPCAPTDIMCPPGAMYQYEVDRIFDSADDIYVGRCPIGHYCPATNPDGSLFGGVPLPCPPGEYQDTHTADECKKCPPGKACTVPGLSSPDADCQAGYFCAGGAATTTPVGFGNPQGGECPVGHYCPTGTNSSIPCPPGEYANVARSATCLPCPPGKHCINGTSTPGLCPAGRVCNISSEPCPIGSYRDAIGLPDDVGEDCAPCLPGWYCRAGQQVGLCADLPVCVTVFRYLCGFGNRHPNPRPDKGNSGPGVTYTRPSATVEYINYTNFVRLHYNPPEEVYGGIQCPPGFYCREGTGRWGDDYKPQECTDGSVRLFPGGRYESDCTNCPAGYYCPPNMSPPIPIVCPAGSYCPEGVQAPIPCPASLYNPFTEKKSLAACIPCPAGRWCTQDGTPDAYDEAEGAIACPVGSYCVNGTRDPIPCPPGTFVDFPGAMDVSDCKDCPPGFYCDFSNNTVPDAMCPPGTYCPGRSARPRVCPARFYCPPVTDPNGTVISGTVDPIECPAGYYCKAGTGAIEAVTRLLQGAALYSGFIDLPECETGFYCPNGTDVPRPCPPGYRGIDGTGQEPGFRTAFNEACIPCEPGTYLEDQNATECLPCRPGYVCVNATNKMHPTVLERDGGYECPLGHFCPSPVAAELPMVGTAEEFPCVAGTYGPLPRQSTNESCLPCPVATFNPLTGKSTCTPCGSSATTPGVGAAICQCVGKNRAFQVSDQACVCAPNFEYIYEDGVDLSDEDGSQDCQEHIFERCSSVAGEKRDILGKCVVPDCRKECGPAGGDWVDSVGLCSCTVSETTDQICDTTCQSLQLTANVDYASSLLVIANESAAVNCSIPLSYLTGRTEVLQSAPTCSEQAMQAGNCTIRYQAANGQFEGNFGFPPSLFAEILDRLYSATIDDCFSGVLNTTAPLPVNITVSRRRRLQATPAPEPGVVNPVTCLQLGESMIWSLTPDASGRIAYPVYEKDALLNTNPDFDYAAFRRLRTDIVAGVQRAMFSFTFDEPGVYVFSLSTDSSQRTVISVMESGQTCPTPLPQTQTTSSLAAAGVKIDVEIELTPDWPLLFGVLSAIVALALLTIPCLWVFRVTAWTFEHGPLGPNSKYSTGVEGKMLRWVRRYIGGEQDGKDDGGPQSARALADIGLDVGEDIDPRIFQAVYDKLMAYHAFVSGKFAEQFDLQKQETQRVLKEAGLIRDALLSKLADALDKQEDAEAEALRHRGRLEDLINDLYRKRDALVEAWRSIHGEAAEMIALEMEHGDRRASRRGSGASTRSEDISPRSKLRQGQQTAMQAKRQHSQAQLGANAEAQSEEALKALMAQLATCGNDAERKALIEQFQQQMQNLQVQLDATKNEELENLKRTYEANENEQVAARQTLEAAQANHVAVEEALAIEREAFNAKQDADREALAEEGAAAQSKITAEFASKADRAYAQIQEQMQRELAKAATPAERAEIISRNQKAYEAVLEGLEQDRLSQEQALQAKLAKRREALRKRQADELKTLTDRQKMQADSAAKDVSQAREAEEKLSAGEEVEALQQQLTTAQDQKIRDMQKRYQTKIELKKTQLQAEMEQKLRGAKTKEERQTIIRDHERAVQKAVDLLDEERAAAQAALERKLQDRQRRRLDAIKKRQEEQQKVRALEDTHTQQWRRLEAQQENERLIMAQDLANQRAKEEHAVKDDTAALLNNLIRDFNAKRADVMKIEDPKERQAAEAELNAWMQQQRESILKDDAYRLEELADRMKRAESEDWAQLKEKHADQSQQLQQQQKKEVETARAQLNKAMDEEARVTEAAEETGLEEELEGEESEAKEGLQRDMLQTKNEMLEKERLKMQAALDELGDATDPETEMHRQQIMDQYERNVAHLEDMLDQERDKQQAELDKRLQQRKAERLEKAKMARQQSAQLRNLEKQQGHDAQLLILQQAAEKLMENAAAAEDAREDVEEFRSRQRSAIRAARTKMMDVALDPSKNAEDKETLLARLEVNEARVVEGLNAERTSQEQSLKEKIAARRARLAAKQGEEASKQQEEHEAAAKQIQEEGEVALGQQVGVTDAALSIARAMASATKEEMAAKHTEELANLQRQQEQALQELKAQMQRELAEAKELLKREMGDEQQIKTVRLEEEKQKLREEAERETAKANTKEEKENILKDFQSRMARIDTAIQEEAQKQDVALEARLAARKKRLAAKEAALKEDNEKQLEAQKLQQLRKQMEAQSAAERQAESESLRQLAHTRLGDDTTPPTEMVKQVLSQRHEREINDLMAFHFREKAHKLKFALDDINKEREKAIAEIWARYPKSYTHETPDVVRKRQKEIDDYDKEHKTRIEAHIKDATRQIDEAQEVEMLALKERHLQELTDAFAELSTIETFVKAHEEGDIVDRAKLDVFKKKKEEEIQQRLKELEEEWARKEAEEKAKLNDELAALERKIEDQAQRDREAAEQRANKLKNKVLSEREELQKKKMQAQLQQTPGADDQMKAEVMKQYEEDQQRLITALDTERERQKAIFEERLEEKKRAQKERQMKKAEEEQKRFKEQQTKIIEKQKKILEKQREQEMKKKEAELRRQSIIARGGEYEGPHPLWDEILNEEETAGTLRVGPEEAEPAQGGPFVSKMLEVERLLREEGAFLRDLLRSLKKLSVVLHDLDGFPSTASVPAVPTRPPPPPAGAASGVMAAELQQSANSG
ncbi:unnamed protein product [Vitrella brassicaformis CCMP3155]|uniref:F5/8 type C domain-containing protein n=5 Tax=Vitrella brassicaformis TaxID=1169539 RepID=A0A0G4GLK9_VITBC|nr:unnamed protein product [Vitrella brassicaformis CCMP3155]|eukprot:CEM31004.1 unnamed protein product [Vitrella brassicaformis CCMP3155]